MPIFSGLRARLQLFLLLAMLPSLALVLYTTFHSWKLTEAYTRDETTRLVRFVASDYQRLVEGTRHLLGALASVSEVRERRGASCSALFARFKTGYPHYANLGAIGPDGYTFCSAVPLTERTKAGDRSYFRRAVETRDFAIGDYQIGRITGMPVVVLAYPSFDNAGRLRTVVFAALDLTWLNQLAVRARLPAGSVLTLLDDKGTIINRYPEPEKWIGKKYPETQLVRTVLANPGGGAQPSSRGWTGRGAFTPTRRSSTRRAAGVSTLPLASRAMSPCRNSDRCLHVRSADSPWRLSSRSSSLGTAAEFSSCAPSRP